MTDKKTLEEALAEMEASNAEAAELKAKNAPGLIAEAMARTALNARLAALPQAQRRKVLDAAGLKHVSAAPPPIEPIHGSSHTPPRATIAPQAIDWHFWQAMRTVKLWQGCALIVGLDPDALKMHPQAWMAGPGAGPVFDGKSFSSLDIKTRFEKALRLAESAVSYMDGPIYPKGQPHPGNNKEKDVVLSEVAAYFRSLEWLDIPTALQSIAAPANEAATPAPVAAASASDSVEPSQVKRRTWRDVAWPYVVETFKSGQYSTAKDYYRALENKAGANDSPFDKGTGAHLHSLYVREICETVTLKTIQNAWADIKASR